MRVYDVTKRQSFDHVARWVDELRAHADTSIVIMLIGNKADLLHSRAVPTEDAVEFAETQNLFFFETSALTGDNVEPAFLKLLHEIHDAVSKKALDTTNLVKPNEGLLSGFKIEAAHSEVSELKNPPTCSCWPFLDQQFLPIFIDACVFCGFRWAQIV